MPSPVRKANVFKSERRPLNKSKQQLSGFQLNNNFLGNPAWSVSGQAPVQESRNVLESPLEARHLENHQLHPHPSWLHWNGKKDEVILSRASNTNWLCQRLAPASFSLPHAGVAPTAGLPPPQPDLQHPGQDHHHLHQQALEAAHPQPWRSHGLPGLWTSFETAFCHPVKVFVESSCMIKDKNETIGLQ